MSSDTTVYQLSCAIKCFPCKSSLGFCEPFKVSFERNRPTSRKREAQIVWSHEKVANLDVYVCARPFIHPLGTAATSSPTPFIRLAQQQIKRPAMKFISPRGALAPHKKATRPAQTQNREVKLFLVFGGNLLPTATWALDLTVFSHQRHAARRCWHTERVATAAWVFD